MFTIDLLKGQGVPAKSRPEGIAVAAVTVAVPVVAAIVMFGFYVSNTIAISIYNQDAAKYETMIDGLSDSVELQKSLEQNKALYSSCLSEVSSVIGRHTQWSPVLATLVKNMPDSVILTGLNVQERSAKRKVPRKDNPEEMISVTVPVRTLKITVSAMAQSGSDRKVRDFRDSLRSSALLGPMLEDIRVSQRFDTREGRDAISYEIDCVFKPGL